MSPELLYLIISILGAIAVYTSSIRDGEQKNRIENLARETHKLELLNKDISNKIKLITDENLNLSKETKGLISNVRDLTDQSKLLIEKVNKQSEYQAATNLISGELLLELNPIKNDSITLSVGSIHMSYPISELKVKSPSFFKIGETEPFVVMYKNNKLYISIQIRDAEGNLLAEVENNFWRPNFNFTGKFNYDSKGFEIIDNEGRVAFNIDVTDNNHIYVKGLFIFKDENVTIIAGEKNLFTIPKSLASELTIRERFKMTYDQYYSKQIKDCNIKQLFEYTGPDWLHKRKDSFKSSPGK